MKMNIHGLKMYGIKVGPYICIPVCYLFDILYIIETDSLNVDVLIKCAKFQR